MGKIEERGRTYALHKASNKLNDYYGSAMLNVVQFDGHDIQCAYVDGYLQAEQDLEEKDEVASTDPIKAMQEALRMEYEKGRADVLRCIDPDEMVADFCSQPLSKTRSLASIYRQGIIDIVKRINSNEETSINSTHSIDNGGVHRA